MFHFNMPSMNKPSPSLTIALISIPIFIGALDLTVVSAVLPHVLVDLDLPQTMLDDAAWVVSGYLLAYTVAITFMGRLSDLIGRRKVYLLALAIFALGSYLVAVADGWPTDGVLRLYYRFFEGRPDPSYVSLLVLIAARMVQAFGGGAMVPVGMALAGDLYPAEWRARPLGVIAAVDTAGWVVGHLYGGIVARYFDWRTIFWLNLPVCALAFGLIWLALRGLPRAAGQGKMDWLGALLVTGALTAFNVGLGSGGEVSTSLGASGEFGGGQARLPVLLGGGILFALFIVRQATARSPLIPLSLFRLQNFFNACLANFLLGFGLFVAIAMVPFFINTLVSIRENLSIQQAAWDSGWMLSALTVPLALASIPGGWLTQRWGYRWPAVLGLFGALAGFVLMRSWQVNTTYLEMSPHLVFAGIGFGLTLAPIASAVINASPPDYRGTASALVIIFRLVGMTLSTTSILQFGQTRYYELSAELSKTILDEYTYVTTALAQVIGETFLVAAAACALAFLPILLLKRLPSERSST